MQCAIYQYSSSGVLYCIAVMNIAIYQYIVILLHPYLIALTLCACVYLKWDIALLHITLLKHDHSQKDVRDAEFLLTWSV